MCITGPKYVELKVYARLVEKGVSPERAEGVARKVARRYEEKRQERLDILAGQTQRRTS